MIIASGTGGLTATSGRASSVGCGQCRSCRRPWTACGQRLPGARFACPQADHRHLGQRYASLRVDLSSLDNPSLRYGLTTLTTASTDDGVMDIRKNKGGSTASTARLRHRGWITKVLPMRPV